MASIPRQVLGEIQRRYAFGVPKDDRFGYLVFQCNICGRKARATIDQLKRENPTCQRCGSTVRYRTVVDLLVCEFFRRGALLNEVPVMKHIRGVGLSDWDGYARRLSHTFDYTNTFLHQPPYLDLRDPPPAMKGQCDFVIASEVLEHVAPPIAPAFRGLRALLKPGGLLVLTVPFSLDAETVEHFPNLFDYSIVERGNKRVLYNRTSAGATEEFDQLVFHGGEGDTLEMRLFARVDLERHLTAAGFGQVQFHPEPNWRHGIYWSQPWSIPLTASATA